MRLMLHIFKKDMRRLWWELAVTLSLLATLARFDCYREDAVPGFIEGGLNLLLPVAWGYLVVLLIHGEAPVGDRQFWITRPYLWPALLGAKVLFALVFIHVPSLLADCVIVAARGFHPLECVAMLVGKQVVLAAALTLPVAMLAAITRNLTQFALATVVIFGVCLLLVGVVEPRSAWWLRIRIVDTVRLGIPWLGLTVMGVAIIWLQYARRRTALSRTLAVTAFLLAGLVFVYISREHSFVVRCALSRTRVDPSQLSIKFDPEKTPPYPSRRYSFRVDRVTLAIPVRVSGVDQATRVGFSQLELEILGPRDELWRMVKRFRRRRHGPSPRIELRGRQDQSRGWQVVMLDPSFYDGIKGAKVKVIGKVAATLWREKGAGRMPGVGAASPVPGLGRCSTALFVDENGEEMLKVICESPFDLPVTRAKLVHPGNGKVWNEGLMRYTAVTWLSPLNRSQAFFRVADEAWGKVSRWLVPRDVLSQAEIELVTFEDTGCTILRYEMRDLDLQEYEVKPAPR